MLGLPGYYQRSEEFTLKKNTTPNQITPSVVNYITNVVQIINSVEGMEENKRLYLPADTFSDINLIRLWEYALNKVHETALANVFAYNEENIKFDDTDAYVYQDGLWHFDEKKTLVGAMVFEKLEKQLEVVYSKVDNKDLGMARALDKLTHMIGMGKSQHTIACLLASKLRDNKLITKLDGNQDLIPFLNGCFSILQRCFRSYEREDYVMTTFGYDYAPNILNELLEKYLKSILQSNDDLEYLLKKASDCLSTKITNNIFLVLLGPGGGNGKSLFINTMLMAFGNLADTISPTAITRKEGDKNVATPSIAKLKGKRFVSISETEEGGKIESSILKRLTGSDWQNARFLNKNEIRFKIQSKFILMTNNLPDISASDSALWRRIRVLDFPYQFVDTPSLPMEKKSLGDLHSYVDNDITWRQAFINILISYLYKDVQEPISVIRSTKRYRDENDEFGEWCNAMIVQSDGCLLSASDVISSFTGELVSVKGPRYKQFCQQIAKFIKTKFNTDTPNKQQTSGEFRKQRGWLGYTILRQ